ncbi:CPBP family intramembrane metalloprotease [bacterium]|nr:CPBP family intramembrane metalloprotease [bacterium]
MNVNVRKITAFVLITFAINWAIVFAAVILGVSWNTPMATAVGVVYMFVPLVSAYIVQKGFYKEPARAAFGINFRLNRWWLFAWLLPLGFAGGTFLVSLLFPGIEFSPDMAGFFERLRQFVPADKVAEMRKMVSSPLSVLIITVFQGLVAGATINAVAGFGEEVGWRGLLMRELAPLGFFKSSLMIGFLWGIWHVPLVIQGHNYPQHPQFGAVMMVGWCILLAPIFNFIRLKSGSVIAASILHGTLNATYGIPIMFIRGGNDLLVGITGLAGFIVLAVVNLLIFIFGNPEKLILKYFN